MPYQSNAELPKGVKVLPAHGQSIWRSAFNSAYEGTCKSRADRDVCATKIAWASVERIYQKNANGEWVEK